MRDTYSFHVVYGLYASHDIAINGGNQPYFHFRLCLSSSIVAECAVHCELFADIFWSYCMCWSHQMVITPIISDNVFIYICLCISSFTALAKKKYCYLYNAFTIYL